MCSGPRRLLRARNMAGTSVSALARFLVAATTYGDGGKAKTDRDHHQHRETARCGAERKARVLARHRPALVRCTAVATSETSRRQHQQHPFKVTSGGTHVSSDDGDDEVRIESNLASPLLSLVYTEDLGRHVVAAAQARAGTLLLREAPYAWSLHQEFSGEFCAHCLEEMTGSTFLCPECGRVAYCSEACATAALQAWHANECLDPSSGAPLDALMSFISPACRVALRALRRAGTGHQTGSSPNECKRQGDELGKDPSVLSATAVSATTTSVVKKGIDACAAWPAVKFGDLQEHYTARSAQERELLETEAAVAAVLTCLGGFGDAGSSANKDGSSGEFSSVASREERPLLAAELVTALYKVSTNAFTVSSLRCSERSVGRHVLPLTQENLAVGIYLAAAMLNHSCTPNALVTFHGREMRVVATRTIEEGEPVTISYGPLASKVPSTSTRQAYMRKAYFFLCECAACRPLAAESTAPASRPGNGDDEYILTRGGHADYAAAAAAPSIRTDFACGRHAESGFCSGTLLAKMSLSHLPKPRKGCELDDAVAKTPLVAAAAADTPALASSNLELWCDSCGIPFPPSSVDALLVEDREDRRLWDEALAAVSRSEQVTRESEEMDQSHPEGSTPARSSRAFSKSCDALGSARSLALDKVVERVKWRDAHLCPASMRRAVAHDVHARILATQEDFAGAADACARAVQVLKKRFAPEDQELGVEFLKLAELCFNAGWMSKCEAACRKARMSLGVCLQPGDEQLAALDTLQRLCAAAFSG